MNSDKIDLNNLNNFSQPVNCSPQLALAAQEVVTIIQDENLSESQKKEAIWIVLNQKVH